jgi:hypothetical protein
MQRTKSLDSGAPAARNGVQRAPGIDMLKRVVPPSSLPSLIMPCPYCGHRMVVTSIEPAVSAEADLEDVTHACKQCGTELVRTVSPEPKVA